MLMVDDSDTPNFVPSRTVLLPPSYHPQVDARVPAALNPRNTPEATAPYSRSTFDSNAAGYNIQDMSIANCPAGPSQGQVTSHEIHCQWEIAGCSPGLCLTSASVLFQLRLGWFQQDLHFLHSYSSHQHSRPGLSIRGHLGLHWVLKLSTIYMRWSSIERHRFLKTRARSSTFSLQLRRYRFHGFPPLEHSFLYKITP
jgi:hypothetical protein